MKIHFKNLPTLWFVQQSFKFLFLKNELWALKKIFDEANVILRSKDIRLKRKKEKVFSVLEIKPPLLTRLSLNLEFASTSSNIFLDAKSLYFKKNALFLNFQFRFSYFL